MNERTGDVADAYATATGVAGGRPYAVVVAVSDRHVVCWCVDQAEARAIAERLNARASRPAARRLVIPLQRRRAS